VRVVQEHGAVTVFRALLQVRLFFTRVVAQDMATRIQARQPQVVLAVVAHQVLHRVTVQVVRMDLVAVVVHVDAHLVLLC
jgi:hypothetical protein